MHADCDRLSLIQDSKMIIVLRGRSVRSGNVVNEARLPAESCRRLKTVTRFSNTACATPSPLISVLPRLMADLRSVM